MASIILDPCAGGDNGIEKTKEIKELIIQPNGEGIWEKKIVPTGTFYPPNAMAYPKAIKDHSGWPIKKFTTLDIREDSLAEVKQNYLTTELVDGQWDMIITNPPFNLAIEIINKALKNVKHGGFVVMLLRLNFFGSQERFPFWQKYMPVYTYVHSKRCKFTMNGKSDSIEYISAVWQRGNYPKFTKLRII